MRLLSILGILRIRYPQLCQEKLFAQIFLTLFCGATGVNAGQKIHWRRNQFWAAKSRRINFRQKVVSDYFN
jgi:hypothetical protein